jgi:hypothetical protein
MQANQFAKKKLEVPLRGTAGAGAPATLSAVAPRPTQWSGRCTPRGGGGIASRAPRAPKTGARGKSKSHWELGALLRH